jgi:hypothetical protein
MKNPSSYLLRVSESVEIVIHASGNSVPTVAEVH